MSLTRHSSRTSDLHRDFLAKILDGAQKYYRIAGYFRSSIFELVGEQIEDIPEVKILCNSDLDARDFKVASNRESALKQRWNDVDIATESLLYRECYQNLDRLLSKGNVEIRVLPKEKLFLHGKAGSVHYADGSRKSFVGSVNETKSAFSFNYELAWQDDDPQSAEWVEREFFSLWDEAVPLPQAIVEEIRRVAHRQEIKTDKLLPTDMPGAALAEAPIYRGGEQLQPWQRSFVTMFLDHCKIYGKARLLLADEVGVGKTLSMAASALITCLMEGEEKEKTVLILAPSTLVFQWQVEMFDRLGVPTAVWSSQQKAWIGVEGQLLSPKNLHKSIAKCPYRIAIVSTGLIMHQKERGGGFIKEAGMLLKNKYGLVILDEAHKARMRGVIGNNPGEPNNLLEFMRQIGPKTKHMILGTATPIQTNVRELWDLLGALNSGAQFVLGDPLSPWMNTEEVVQMVTGKISTKDIEDVWKWISNPLPPNTESVARAIRSNEEWNEKEFTPKRIFGELDPLTSMALIEGMDSGYFVSNNPILRHTVLRKRSELEKMGLLEKISVKMHPLNTPGIDYKGIFNGSGISTNGAFEIAYEQAEEFCKLLSSRTRCAGFMKTLMLQRICSSFAAGLSTAERMLNKSLVDINEDDESEDIFSEEDIVNNILQDMSSSERQCLQTIVEQLSRPEAVDPKLETVKWFLKEFRTENKSWMEHGCIIFSQYFDTASWVAEELAKAFPDSVIALYAGAGKSGLYRNDQFNPVERDSIKTAVRKRQIQLVVATDAACEGLNLQTLGTLINVDLPWNPSRLEQRLGRIKRFGQSRSEVDMLNLVYTGTQDEKIYDVLSVRLKDIHDIFGSLPDFLMDDWIASEEELKARANQYMHERDRILNSFDIKYNGTANPNENLWEQCSRVLSRRDIAEVLTQSWK